MLFFSCISLRLQLWVDLLLQDEPARLRQAGIKQISQERCGSDLLLRAAL